MDKQLDHFMERAARASQADASTCEDWLYQMAPEIVAAVSVLDWQAVEGFHQLIDLAVRNLGLAEYALHVME